MITHIVVALVAVGVGAFVAINRDKIVAAIKAKFAKKPVEVVAPSPVPTGANAYPAQVDSNPNPSGFSPQAPSDK